MANRRLSTAEPDAGLRGQITRRLVWLRYRAFFVQWRAREFTNDRRLWLLDPPSWTTLTRQTRRELARLNRKRLRAVLRLKRVFVLTGADKVCADCKGICCSGAHDRMGIADYYMTRPRHLGLSDLWQAPRAAGLLRSAVQCALAHPSLIARHLVAS